MNASLKEKIRHEAKSFLVIFLYVWAILALFALHKDFLLARSPLDGQVFALINALVLGKLIIILEFFGAGRRLERHPAIFRIAGKSIIFGLLLLAFHILEEGIRGWFHGQPFSRSLAEIDGGRLLEIGTLVVMFVVTLTPYFFLREIVRELGTQKLRKILLERPAAEGRPAA